MEASDLPPLPPIKKRKGKGGKRGTMNRSRSFVAEMFHIKNPSNEAKKWSNNDMQLFEKLGISPSHKRNEKNEDSKLKISANLHPDLKQHAYEEQINSLSIELDQTRKNLMKAAEYGQHLIEENQKLESVVLELRNDAAEYISQICELREENDTFKLEVQTNEYSVNDYENKMYQVKSDKNELNNKLSELNEEISNIKLKYEMEKNKRKLYQNEIEKYQMEKSKLNKQYNKHMDQLKTKILVLKNTNHSVLMDRDESNKKYEKIQQEMHILENEYTEICNQYNKTMAADGASSISGDSPHRFTNISRRRSHSHSRSRSDKRGEEFSEEKMDEIVQNSAAEYKTDPVIKNINEYGEILIECMDLFENIMDDQHIHSPIKLRLPSNNNINNNDDNNNKNNNVIDIDLFKDLMQNVRNKLKNEKYGGDIHKRNLSELRRNSIKSNSVFMCETLDNYILSTDEEQKNEQQEHEIIEINENENEENKDEYFADNEDLDNGLPNKIMLIEPIDDQQKKCVEQFLVRYSEDESWNNRHDNNNEYELEIEFNENINLQNKKNNNIAISAKLLQSLTNLIENIMDIPCNMNEYNSSYFSMCGWFCGKTPNNKCTDYSKHYLNILSTLDYKKENREEIYWVIYQLLNIIYKYYNHTQKGNQNLINANKNNSNNTKKSNGDAFDNNNNVIGENIGNISDSESLSMILTQSKSKYAELKPPPKRRKNKNKNSRGSFHPLNTISSDSDDITNINAK